MPTEDTTQGVVQRNDRPHDGSAVVVADLSGRAKVGACEGRQFRSRECFS